MRTFHHFRRNIPETTTPERRVRSLGTVLGLWAHPDDETYLAGGLMALVTDAGQRVVTACATSGEQGGAAGVDPSKLARRRRRELRAALRHLGVHDHAVFSFPDGGCAGVPHPAGVAAFAELIERVGPDTIVTFAPDGLTGHQDHRTVSAWATDAWAATGRGARLLHATVTPDFADRNRDIHEQIDAFEPGSPLVTHPSDVSLRFVLDDATLVRKIAALRAHRSQTQRVVRTIGATRFSRWWDEECFVDAVPSTRAAVSTLATAFDERTTSS